MPVRRQIFNQKDRTMNNAIVIMFDSLQHNYLGCYGNDWIKTPNMDRLAREGVLFENCYVENLPTVPCRRSMHTGCYGLHESGWSPLKMEDTTIADLCWGRPIDTALIYDCPMYRLPKFGYIRGFDKCFYTHGQELDHFFYENDPLYHYKAEDFMEQHTIDEVDKIYGNAVIGPHMNEVASYLKQMQYWKTDEDRYVAKTIKASIKYLEQVDRNKAFFLFIDSFDPHEPWNPPSVIKQEPCPYDPDYKGKHQFLPIIGTVEGVFTEEELHHVRMLYAEDVTVCDKWLGVLLDKVRELGFEENTLFMMVSDHGEPMGNDEHGHGIMRKCRPWPYEELAHAPMLLRAPGIKAGQRIKAFVQSCDVAPTVCEWLGIGVHPQMTGKSLLPLCRGEVEKVRDFAVAGYYKYAWCLYTEDWSYMHWLHDTKAVNAQNGCDFYMADGGVFLVENSAIDESIPNTSSESTTEFLQKQKEAKSNIDSDVHARQQAAASLDGEEQWTCTPGSIAEVPEQDCLFDRKNDPFQLNNVIDQYPEIARKLLLQLNDFMDSLPRKY